MAFQDEYPRITHIPADYTDEEYLRAVFVHAADVMHVDPDTITVLTTSLEGDTALHTACLWGDLRAVKLLLAAGAHLDARGDMNATPLYFAVMRGFTDIADYLLANGADANARSEFGDTPRDLARGLGLNLTIPVTRR